VASTIPSANWHFIHINSNGNDKDLYVIDKPYSAFEQYTLFLANQEENVTSSTTSMCWQNIQKKYGTCVTMGSVLIFVLFRLICGSVRESNNDSIGELCRKFSHKMSNENTIHIMNELITDMRLTILHLIVKTSNELQEFDESKIINNKQVWNAILLYSETDTSIAIDVKIFDIMCNMEYYMMKNIDKIKDYVQDYDTDTEIPASIKRRKMQIRELEYFVKTQTLPTIIDILKDLKEYYDKHKLEREFDDSDIAKIHALFEKLNMNPSERRFSEIAKMFFFDHRERQQQQHQQQRSFGKELIRENIKRIKEYEMIMREEPERRSLMTEKIKNARDLNVHYSKMLAGLADSDFQQPITDASQFISFFSNMEKLYKISRKKRAGIDPNLGLSEDEGGDDEDDDDDHDHDNDDDNDDKDAKIMQMIMKRMSMKRMRKERGSKDDKEGDDDDEDDDDEDDEEDDDEDDEDDEDDNEAMKIKK
jgi:hypothetical protein